MTTYSARNYPDFTARVPADAKRVEYEGKVYRQISVPEPTGRVPTGRYLVNDAGKIIYLIDPGVCGTDLQRAVRVSGPPYEGFSAGYLPESAPTFLTAEGPQKILELTSEREGVSPGKYLVDSSGALTHRLTSVTKYDAPKARLFSLIIDGILTHKLPWALVLIGISMALIMELVGVSSLPFAVGLYLPISTSTPIFIGGLIRMLVDRKRRNKSDIDAEFSPGVLLASGLIAGGAIAGLTQAVFFIMDWNAAFDKSYWLGSLAASNLWTLVPFGVLAFILYYVASHTGSRKDDGKEAIN
jgi:hypothetical protein